MKQARRNGETYGVCQPLIEDCATQKLPKCAPALSEQLALVNAHTARGDRQLNRLRVLKGRAILQPPTIPEDFVKMVVVEHERACSLFSYGRLRTLSLV